LEKIGNTTIEKMTAIKGIGPKKAEKIIAAAKEKWAEQKAQAAQDAAAEEKRNEQKAQAAQDAAAEEATPAQGPEEESQETDESS